MRFMASTLMRGPDLKVLRRSAGMSQQRLAELAGCSVSMVRVLESGYEPERSDVLPRLLAALPTTREAPAGNQGFSTTGVGVAGNAPSG